VPIDETVRSFREVLDGKHDELPESAFFMKGGIDEVVDAANKGSGRREEQPKDEAEAEGEQPEDEQPEDEGGDEGGDEGDDGGDDGEKGGDEG
jgi:F-type H+-transporting ATPase subunit beta